MNPPLLRIEGLRAGYGHVEVLHGISLVVPEGRMVAIVGPNGAGKTTLMSAVMGLLPVPAPSSIAATRPEQPKRWSPPVPCWCLNAARCSPT